MRSVLEIFPESPSKNDLILEYLFGLTLTNFEKSEILHGGRSFKVKTGIKIWDFLDSGRQTRKSKKKKIVDLGAEPYEKPKRFCEARGAELCENEKYKLCFVSFLIYP